MDELPATVSDHDLLRAYADDGSQAAFAELVARHVNLVYSAARRQLGGGDYAHLVDDVTQAVFLILSNKARSRAIADRVVLAGWLFNTTRHAAANARKIEARRRYHERKGGATMTRRPATPDESARWEDVAPLLDGALARLPRGDRDAVLLKFMEEKSHRTVGDTLGISEEAARKRVSRGLERLRALLGRGGVAAPAVATLATMLAADAAHAAPPAVHAACALAGSTSGAAAATTTAAVAKATVSTLSWLHAKAVAAALAAALILTGGVGYAAHRLQAQAPTSGAAAPRSPAVPVLPVAAPGPVKVDGDVAPIEGVVVGVDGRPLAGVEVYAATPQQPVNLYADRQRVAMPVVTRFDGTFSLDRPAKDWVLVALSPEGVAQVQVEDLDKPGGTRVVLQPWGRVEGRLFAGDKPLPNQLVHIAVTGFADDPLTNCVINQTPTRTDKDGRFVFPRVPPGSPMLSHWDERSSIKSSKWDEIDVRPGQTVTVDLGATGRPVVGRLVVPPGWENKITFVSDKVHSGEVSARRTDIPDLPMPPGFEKLSPLEQLRAQVRLTRAPERKEYRRNMYAEEYVPRPDGTFRLDALRPGKYALAVRLFEHDRENAMLEDVAGARAEFTIPPTPPGVRFVAEPIDVGRIVLEPVARIVPGQPAPAFEARTVDGDPVKLADYKGRLLVVQFRWPRVHGAETAGMGKAHAAFANDPRVAFLTVHVDADPKDVRRLVTDESLEWPQAIASRGGAGGLPEGYAQGPAMIHLIAPDGTLRRKVLRTKDLERAIAQALLEGDK